MGVVELYLVAIICRGTRKVENHWFKRT